MANQLFDAKSAGVAIGRWALGLLMLYGGVGKFMGGINGFVNGYLINQFSKTFLPPVLVMIYGYTLPFIELALGVLLIIGLYRNITLLLTGLTLISLSFGQMLLQKHEVVANNFIYIILTVILLWSAENDFWVLDKKKHNP